MAEEAKFPIFVIGSSRSGTTLLFSFLLASGEFPLYEEGETHLSECRRKYGNPRKDRNFRRFLNDWLPSLQFRRSGLDEQEFVREVWRNRQSYEHVMRTFMESMARREGKARWAEKTPANVFHMDRLAAAFPDARFVHVIRDGRDVALSIRRLGWTGTRSRRPLKQLVCAGKYWEWAVTAARAGGRRLGDRYLEVRYEELVSAPESVLDKVGRFTETVMPASVAGTDIGAFREGFSAFDDRMTGLSQRALFRWKSTLTEPEVIALSAAIGPTLRHLGYECDRTEGSLRRRLAAGMGSATCHLAFRTRHWMAERTPLGRLSAARFEFEDQSDSQEIPSGQAG